MSRSRPDYVNFLQWLNISDQEVDPLTILACSGEKRETDSISVFPCPEPDAARQYQLQFFFDALRHLPESATEPINRLQPEEKLWLAHEFQNPHDAQALTFNTEDHHIVGYCPRYLRSEVFDLLRKDPSSVDLRIEREIYRPHRCSFVYCVG